MAMLLLPAPTRNRTVVGAGLIVLTVLAWGYLFLLSARMGTMGSSLAMPMTSAWTSQDLALMWTMWAVMMAAMMLPSAAPMISAYSATLTSPTSALKGSTPAFVAGYVATWAGFAMIATIAQWVLHDAALVNAMGASTSDALGGGLLLAAGLYQFTGAKDACLKHCRSPLGFLLNEWRGGVRGAAAMGMRHGAVCVGCCWALMALLFVLGVMNLWWIALVAAVVLLEKLLPTEMLTRTLGAALVLWGCALLGALAW